MPTPPLTDDKCREALNALSDCGGVKAHAAKSLGMDANTFKHRLKTAYERGLHLSDGIRSALGTTRIAPGEARHGWSRVQDEDGSFHSVFWKNEETTQDFIDQVRDAFAGIKRVKPVKAPKDSLSEYLTVYPLMDVHFGMLAWRKETGQTDYDMGIAADEMRHAFAKISRLTPKSQEAILLVGGDFFHADDDTAETPQSGHSLDVDGRHFKVLDSGVQLVSEVIDSLLGKHKKITIRVLRGNHDLNSHMVLTFALAERYRDEPRIAIEKNPMDLFHKQWGRTLIAAHHGDKAKGERLALYLSDVCPYWSETRHRYCFLGHLHHNKQQDVGPLHLETLRAFCPPDSYAAGMGYASRRALQALTFSNKDGLIIRAMDPIERSV